MYTKLKYVMRPNKEVFIYGNCIVTGETYSVTVNEEDIKKYQEGALAQDAFPYLTSEEREFLISGVSPNGWRKMFG